MTDPLKRFSDRVEDYAKYRPSYPAALVDSLAQTACLGPDSRVADIGAGTGIFTRLLLRVAGKVFAVEPNAAMRAAAEADLGGRPGFESVPGTAEATGLAPASVQLVACAQAFHWFDPARTRLEFIRILQPGGWCALVWNTSKRDGSPFAEGYERIKKEFGTDFGAIRHENLPPERFSVFFGHGRWEKRIFPNSQVLDYPSLRGRLLSSSYAPKPDHPRHPAMIAALEELFARTERGGVVEMVYNAELILGQFA